MKLLFRIFLATALLAARAWCVDVSTNFVDYNVQINGHAARMIFASSLGSPFVLEDSAHRLGFGGEPFSPLTEVLAGGKTINVPIYVLGDPIKKVPWTLRQAAKITHPFLYHEFMKLYDQVTKSMDGVVGWPQVRNNILLFDAEQRVIRRLEQLPPEIERWQKLRVLPIEQLMLEVPLGGDKNGVVFVDTADSRSVMLAPAAWKQWKDGNPAAAVVPHKVWGLPLIVETEHEAFADKVEIGPLAITHVMVADMDDDTVDRLLGDIPQESTAWSLGMGALLRMDLIVDAKNGWAYARPKPSMTNLPPTLTRKSRKAVDALQLQRWTLSDDVVMEADGFFLREGEHRWRHEDYKGARTDLSRALEINPHNAVAWERMGAVEQYEGDFTAADACYDNAIKLRPEFSAWQRLYRQSLLWRVTTMPSVETKAAAKGAETTNAAVNLAEVEVVAVALDGVPGVNFGWPKTVGQYLVGHIDEKAFLAAAKKSSDSDENKAIAYYYIGMTHLSSGDRTGARVWLQRCKDAGQKDDDEYHFAVAELKRLSEPVPAK